MKVGVVGLGAMGAGIANNLNKAGMLQAAWNRTLATAEAVARETGIAIVPGLEQLAGQCDVILTSVSRDDDLLEVIQNLKPCLQAGSTVIDTSTVNAGTARKVAQILAEVNADFLDVPVSGGPEGARNATLSMMVGGEADVLERVRPVLEVISARITHMGPTGNGQATKAVNQVMVAGINQAVTEALAFGEAMQLPMDKVIEAVSSGAAGNWFIDHRGTTMINGTFAPGFKVALHDKDLAICQAMAASVGKKLRVVDMTREEYSQLIQEGFGEEDISSLYRIKSR